MNAKLLIVLAGIAMLAACKGSVEKEALIDSLMDDSVLVKTADMQLKVKNVQQTAEKITNLVADRKGLVMHHNMHSEILSTREIKLSDDSVKRLTVYNINADLTIKVPSDFIESFMDSVNRLSTYVNSRSLDIEDRTAEHVEEALKIVNREESIDLRRKIKPTHSGADSVLAIADNVVDRQIANVRTEQAAAYSTVILKLYENNVVKAEMLANEDLASYNLPLFKRIGLALSNGWGYFADFIIGLLHLWPFIVVICLGFYAVFLFRKRKALKHLPS